MLSCFVFIQFLKKITVKVEGKKQLKFQQATYKMVPISLTQNYFKIPEDFLAEEIVLHCSFLEVYLMKSGFALIKKLTHILPWFVAKNQAFYIYLFDESRCLNICTLSQLAFTCSNLSIETPRTKCEICSELNLFFIVNFEHILHLDLVFLLITLSR